eukprot:CAMPEP_0182421162 /NCGR_PEP_ID=MMETSP1167-20130531/6414_1 /TAXON_ID=2988 /ORGANISM="Mallomonas Sp, Strain CCMP3275" /LENGTH=349 /DNA_ID=CAMNT_0024598013 /DNA_START=130 /DNA_END=1176 /DNA_ORIENTATION=+
MSTTFVLDNSVSVVVKRGDTTLSSSDTYVAGESLTVTFSLPSGFGEYVLETSNGQFTGGSCSNKRIISTSATIIMPTDYSQVSIWAAYASGRTNAKISSTFVISAETKTPTALPTVAPSTSLTPTSPTVTPTHVPSSPSVTPTITPTSPSVSPTSSPHDQDDDHDSDGVCFSGSETVQMESGITKLISEVIIGDIVLSYSPISNSTVYSPVISLPHKSNNITASFIHITTDTNNIKLTPSHFILAGECGREMSLKMARNVQREECVITTYGEKRVIKTEKHVGKGIYTVITTEEYVVVSGFVASPFAMSHRLGNMYYQLHRVLYHVAPNMIKSQLFQDMSQSLAHLFYK